MKKLLFAVSALAALSLLAPSTGLAQDVPPEWVAGKNLMSLYSDTAGTSNSLTMTPFTTGSVYLVVHDPYNYEFAGGGQDVTSIGGVEFAVYTTGSITILSLAWPVTVVDVGTAPSHVAGFGTPVTVSNNSALLCTINFFLGGDSGAFQLGPSSPSSVTTWEAMAVLDMADEGICELLPPYLNFDYNVLGVNLEVATESTTIDAVKALYR